MILKSPRLWIAVFSAAAVAYVAMGDLWRTSPGPLATVHERELTGWRSCSKCHGGWFDSMAEACLDCHEEIAGQIEKDAGFHGALEDAQATECALCHSDHHGPDFRMVNDQSFLQAGFESQLDFDHEFVGFPMEGKHLELACAKCHVNAEVAILPEDQTRFLGLERDCAKCHEDSHEGKYQVACAKCHSQQAWDQRGSAGHEEHLALVGGHGDVSCVECHAEKGPHSLETLGIAGAQDPRACQDCHDSPHAADFVAQVAVLSAKTPKASCIVCHGAEHTSFRDERATVTPEQHACSGFPLDVPHHDVACAECHVPEAPAFRARYPGRGPDECSTCHLDVHGGQFATGPFGGQECTACHERERFEPHTFTVEKHAQLTLALDGSHLELDCHACHKVPAPTIPRVFHGTPFNCDGCHPDAHAGFFDQHAGALAAASNGMCASCHLTTTFRERPAAGFDHARWTGFAVEGAHAQAECEICHPRADAPDDTGRTLGRVEEHFGAFEGCATCHKDPHRGEFDAPEYPRIVDGKSGCMRCHVQTSFRTFPDGFDHGRWTGFPLSGAHVEAGCSACHQPLRKPDAFGRTWGRADGGQCADCHDDPHAGQFERDGSTSCQRCHRSAMTFKDLVFRHNLDSRFRLGEAHKDVACAACHRPVREGGVEFVRYRPLGRECSDCHTAQNNPLRPHKGRQR